MAKIGELLKAGPTYSFEFPPPRTEALLREFEKTVQELEPLEPSFCSVTYGAGGSSRENTLDAVLHIQRDTSLNAMPHLTCVAQTRDDITALVERYRDEGIENLLALAGDPPLDNPDAPSDFTYATELIELAREVADFSICVAAFPEVHPRSSDRESDRRLLAAKLALADFAITQFFWDADDYFRMRDELDALGATTPVIPSLFPIINVRHRPAVHHHQRRRLPRLVGRAARSGGRRRRRSRQDRHRRCHRHRPEAARRRSPRRPHLHPQPLDVGPRGLEQPRSVELDTN